jgi:hypothetical protein
VSRFVRGVVRLIVKLAATLIVYLVFLTLYWALATITDY